MTLLDLKHFNLSLLQRYRMVPILKDISLSITTGETLGIVGESGSGKSLLMYSLLGILPKTGEVSFESFSFNNFDISKKDISSIRPSMAMILQDPKASLNPVMTIGEQIREALILQGAEDHSDERVIQSLKEVSIEYPKRVFSSYPSDLSGGMAQRVMIAMMLALKPKLLIADEPTSSLDAHIQRDILALLREKACQHGMTLVIVSHDLPLVSTYCDRVVVMYKGSIVEICKAEDLNRSTHPYTKGLLACLPRLNDKRKRLPVLNRGSLES
jgi:peptide/nickel transport system ATP-binding protein